MADRSSARPRGVTVSLVVAGVLFVAGCTGSGDGAASSTSSATSSPAATATSAPSATTTAAPSETSALPPLPDAAKENTPEGAEAFIRYYFDVTNDLYMEPPAADVIDGVVDDRLVDPDCISCETLRRELKQLSEGGQRVLDELYTIDSMERIGGGPPDVQRFNMMMTLQDHVIETTASGEQYEFTGKKVEGIGAAVWTGTQWITYGMELG